MGRLCLLEVKGIGASSDRIRVCVFHLKNTVAAAKVALAHECLGTMFADCLHYQVDLIGGDPNMALHRAMQPGRHGHSW